MARSLTKFARNDIISLTGEAVRYDLAESVGPDLTLGRITDGGLGDLSALPLAYGGAQGRADLRLAIAARHEVSADDVVTTVGGMHALYLTARILCEPGDEIVLTAPLFPNTGAVLALTGATIKTVPLSFDEGYRLDPDVLRPHLTARTRLVCLTSPQNPSGVMLPTQVLANVLQDMQAICPDAYLLLDETYREAVHGNASPVPSPIYLSRRIISTASLSKCHGAPGLRLGWAITRDGELREQFILGKFTTVICCSAVDEALALRVLEQSGAIVEERRRHLQDGLARVAEWVARERASVAWVRPDAGALCCVRLRPDAVTDAGVADFYTELTRQSVRVAPGTWFGESARVFRLGFGMLPIPDLDEALARMSGVLRRVERMSTAAA